MNDEFAAEEGTELACGVLRALAALLAGNESARKRLSHDVGECSGAGSTHKPHKPGVMHCCAWLAMLPGGHSIPVTLRCKELSCVVNLRPSTRSACQTRRSCVSPVVHSGLVFNTLWPQAQTHCWRWCCACRRAGSPSSHCCTPSSRSPWRSVDSSTHDAPRVGALICLTS